LHLVRIWRALNDPNNVFFLFEVASTRKAREFISKSGAAKAGESSGVLGGEYHFVEDAGGY
jgi:hypothetical protein